jgi:hypothetical protein
LLQSTLRQPLLQSAARRRLLYQAPQVNATWSMSMLEEFLICGEEEGEVRCGAALAEAASVESVGRGQAVVQLMLGCKHRQERSNIAPAQGIFLDFADFPCLLSTRIEGSKPDHSSPHGQWLDVGACGLLHS